jgi:thiol-disulfide isomerase/thioredoxin
MGRRKRRHPKHQKFQRVEKRTSKKRIIEEEKRKEGILGLMMIISLIIIVIAGGWYLLQPRGQSEVSSEKKVEHPGIPAPNFSLTDLKGNIFQLIDYRGKVIVIDFMATWCGPCRQQMPHYKLVFEKYKECDCVVLMSIDIDPRESEETLRAFAQEFPYATWIWARDTANLAQAYEVFAIPKTVIIDQDGYIRFTHTGVTDATVLVKEIEQLLREDMQQANLKINSNNLY